MTTARDPNADDDCSWCLEARRLSGDGMSCRLHSPQPVDEVWYSRAVAREALVQINLIVGNKTQLTIGETADVRRQLLVALRESYLP